MPRRLLLPTALSATLLAVAMSACSAPTPSSASDAAPATQLAVPDRTVLAANSTAKLGTVVIDGLGWTLYRSDADSAKPPTSACTGSCADEWPPVLMQSGTPDYEGVDPSIVGTITRDDGRQQVTIGGWPVYRHASDPAPGTVDGQGAQGKWFAVTPTGGKAAPA
jgi:predicted lipoprotein with Yx(FWY)xxD motif